MTERYQLGRHSLVWILASVVMVVVPHLARMPVWLIILCFGCIACRILIHQGRIPYPGARLKGLLVVTVVMSVLLQFGRDVFSTEATVGILIVGIALKLLEMHSRRDVLLVIYLCYFAGVAEFIYSQTIPVACYMLLATAVITSALISLNQHTDHQHPWRTFRLSSLLLLQSAPLMMALFVLFPRMSPLWSVPVQSSSGITGLSDTMSPGDIGNLTRSAEVAFRASFDSGVPDKGMLYWRALTLDIFDGREWSRQEGRFSNRPQFLGPDAREPRDWYLNIEYQGDPLEYNIILEPTNQNWLFTLMMPRMSRDDTLMLNNYQLESLRPIRQRLSYDVRSYPEYSVGSNLDEDIRRRSLGLPRQGNPESRALAMEMRAAADNEMGFVEAVLEYFRQQPFFYTLDPPVLSGDSIDQFLFNTREGFCEHYASAFTYMMRAGGIPARVVTGYQGGDINPYDNTLVVRQYDAHAWSEVWIEDVGWLRVDPTAAVAPERISLGSELVFQENASFLSDVGYAARLFRSNLLLNELRLRFDTIDYAWNRWVLNYDRDNQYQLFSRLFDVVTRAKIVLAVSVFMLAFTALFAVLILRRPTLKPQAPATRLYLKLCRLLEKLGYPRAVGETPGQYCQRLAKERPAWAQTLEQITLAYEQLAYEGIAGEEKRARRLDQMKRAVRQFSVLN